MTFSVRLLRSTYEQAMTDLLRPHPFAMERVGFFYGRASNAAGPHTRLLMVDYLSIPDEHYIDDPGVGARINAAAIRAAMQHCLSTGDVALHVHLHDHAGEPMFSFIDERELGRLVPSFGAVAPHVPHGALVLSQDNGTALIWTAKNSPTKAASVSVIGFPTLKWGSP